MKLSQLQALTAIANGQGIAGAAANLNISKPAVTKSLANLERELGIELLDRSEYRLKLTIYGERLLSTARIMTLETEKAIHDIDLMRQGKQQLIRVNGSPGTLPKLIPLALQRARLDIPGLMIEFEGQLIGSPKEKYEGLSQGLYDLLIYPVEEDHDLDEFINEPLLDIKLIVLARKGHIATKLNKPSLEDLQKFEWLLPSKEGIPNRLIRQAFLKSGAKFPETTLTLPMREMIFSFLRNGDQLAFAPYNPFIWGDEFDEFAVIDVDMPELGWTLHLVQRKSYVPSSGMISFIDSMKEIMKESI